MALFRTGIDSEVGVLISGITIGAYNPNAVASKFDFSQKCDLWLFLRIYL